MRKRILLYYPPNKRSVAIETLCKAVVESGNELLVLTLTERGDFHKKVEELGIKTYSTVMPRKPSWKYFLQQARFLIRFCREHKIDSIWSHLQEANMIALLAKRFMKVEVISFRHHAESAFYAEYGDQFGMQRNKNEERMDRLINRMAELIVVPSSGVWYGMERYEKADMGKVRLVPYIYDFATYAKPDPIAVQQLRMQYDCHLILIMVSRMVATKQHRPVFEIVKQLHQEGLSVKMIVMDDGPLRPALEEFIKENNLQSVISLVGFRTDFINFMAVADLLIHPSLTEASNNVVKELALMEKAVSVCKDVGDFNDYIEEGRNGYFIDRKDLTASIERIIRTTYKDKESLKKMGAALKADVLRLFDDTQENRKRFIDLIKN